MKKIAVAAALLLSFGASAADEQTPQQVVNGLFDAMRLGNGAAITKLVVEEARLDRLKKDGSLHQGTFTDWINWVNQQKAGDADEQIFGVETFQKSPQLATVWAPFIIHYKGKLVGCGVNQFTLAKSNKGWRILYGIDMPHSGDCGTYRKQFD